MKRSPQTLALTAALVSQLATAGGWQVEEMAGEFFLTHPTRTPTQIQSAGGVPRFLAEVPWGSHLTKVIYDAGISGTSRLIGTERALLLETQTGAIIGDYPYRYRALADEPSDFLLQQPLWELNAVEFRIVDDTQGLNQSRTLSDHLLTAYADNPCLDIATRADSLADPQDALQELGGCLASRQPLSVHLSVVVSMIGQSIRASDRDAACQYGELLSDMVEYSSQDNIQGSREQAGTYGDRLAQGLAYCPR